jgi:hypothetical protein
MIFKRFLHICAFAALFGVLGKHIAHAGWPSNLPLRLPAPAIIGKPLRPLPRFPTAAAYRQYADRTAKDGRYEEAAAAYRAEAALYRRMGLRDAAVVEENKAARYATDVRLFLDRAVTPQEQKSLYTGARLEPVVGSYLGAFIDRDERLTRIFHGETWQTHRWPQDFARIIGKPHASYFMYLSYGRPFPRTWLLNLKREGVIPHIAWEPRSLNQVQNDAYLQNFTRQLGELNWPVFIRFAGEMNGFWTPYHSNPALYKQKFRLIHQMLRRNAPRAATIWCVNSVPLDNIPLYYPGDDGCDWVGINLYSVAYYDNNPRRPAFQDNPLALIDPIYKMYAARKPISICEYAASHMAAVDRKPRVGLAIEKMSLLYGALPRLYPRIKMIDWFNMNNLLNARPGRQLNNYSLTQHPELRTAYRRVVSEPYFLAEPQRLSDTLPRMPRPLITGTRANGNARISVWVKTYVPRPKVYLHVAGRILYSSNLPGAHVVDVDTSTLPVGRVPVTAFVYDDRNRFVRSVSSSITVVR